MASSESDSMKLEHDSEENAIYDADEIGENETKLVLGSSKPKVRERNSVYDAIQEYDAKRKNQW